MRVLIMVKTNVGGLWILPHVAELQSRGHDVSVLLPTGPGRLRSALDQAGIRVLPTVFDFQLRAGPSTARGVLEVRRILRRERPDVLVYHLIATALVARMATVGLCGVRTVHMVPGPLYLESPVIAAAESVLARLDDHVIGGSDYTRARYAALRYPGHRLGSIPYGVDTVRFQPGPDRRTDLLGVGRQTFVVIMAAYVYAPKSAVFPGVGIKGHETLLRAWRSFHAAHPDSLLVLVGGGFDAAGEAHRRQLLAALDGDSGVTWVGTVDDVRPYYDSADVSVSPSLSENHGAALEASSMGRPSIVSDAGALPETVTQESGWVVPAGDDRALERALTLAHDRHRAGDLATMGGHARRNAVARFDAATCARRFADLVEQQGPTLLVVTEQRCAADEQGEVVGSVGLGALQGVQGVVRTRLLAREGGRGHLTRLLPGVPGRLVGWSSVREVAAAVVSLVSEVRRAQAVVVYAPGSIGSIAGAAALALGRPLAVVAVGDPREALQPPVTRGAMGAVLRAALPRAMRAICQRAAVVRYVTSTVLQERYPTRGRAVAGADLEPHRVSGTGVRDSHRPARTVLTIASLEQPYKGISELVEAVAAVQRGGLPAELVVVGDGRLRPSLERAANAALAPGSYVFTGQLGWHDGAGRGSLVEALSRSDLFVLASWTEGLPRALVEAMAAGVPCIGTRVGGVIELLTDDALVTPRDPAELATAITRGLTDSRWRAQNAMRGIAVSAEVAECAIVGHDRFITFVTALMGITPEAPSGISRTTLHID